MTGSHPHIRTVTREAGLVYRGAFRLHFRAGVRYLISTQDGWELTAKTLEIRGVDLTSRASTDAPLGEPTWWLHGVGKVHVTTAGHATITPVGVDPDR